ncbi:hypothetical protein ACW4TU_16015 [Streptomyces sp. QTS52]
MTSFHSWAEVKEEVFDAEELDEISAGALHMVAEARRLQLAECADSFSSGSPTDRPCFARHRSEFTGTDMIDPNLS